MSLDDDDGLTQYFTLPHLFRAESELSEDSLSIPSKVRAVRRQSKHSPSTVQAPIIVYSARTLLGLCLDIRTALGLHSESAETN